MLKHPLALSAVGLVAGMALIGHALAQSQTGAQPGLNLESPDGGGPIEIVADGALEWAGLGHLDTWT